MAIKAKDLRFKAGQHATRQKEILAKASDMLTPDEEKEFDSLHDQEQILLKQAKKIEEREKIDAEDVELSREVEKTLRPGELTPDKKKAVEEIALKAYLLTGNVPEELRSIMRPAAKENDDRSMISAELKKLGFEGLTAQQNTGTGSGGYTIPIGFQAELEIAMKEYGGMYANSRILKTSSGNTLQWPMVNDTANIAYQLGEAVSAETSATKITDAQVSFSAYKWTSGLIRLSSEIIEDSAFNMPEIVKGLLGERMGRGINHAATINSGIQTITGLYNTTTSAGAAAYGGSFATGAPTYDEWVELEAGLDPAYRKKAKWMFADNTLKTLKKLKDSQNLPVWLNNAREGAPSTFLGYEYIINQDMAYGTVNSAKIAGFGDLSKYIIRQVNDMRIVRLNERFGDTDEIGFVVFFRWDGKLLDAGTHPFVFGRVDAT